MITQTNATTVATPQIIKSCRGQALTEFLVSILGLLIGAGLFFVVVFFITVHFQIKFELQRSLICLTSKSPHFCNQRLSQALSWSHLGGSISEVHLERTGARRSATLTFSVKPLLGQKLKRKYSLRTEQL